jgi:glycosyltransferase involved in cell wall biosynthesis/spore maturation protein CgeB
MYFQSLKKGTKVAAMSHQIRSLFIRVGILRHHPPLLLPYRKEVILSMKRPVNLEKIEKSLTLKLNIHKKKSLENLSKSISYLCEKKRRKDASNFFVAALRGLSTIDAKVATEFGLLHIFKIPDSRAVRTIVTHLNRIGNREQIPQLLELVGSSPWKVKINSLLLKESSNLFAPKLITPTPQKVHAHSLHFESSKKPSMITRKFQNTKDLKIACILDNFSYSAFKFEANFFQLSVDKYKEELDDLQPDLLFIESAWRGKDGLWGSKVGHADREVIEILQWCKDKNVPTIFWNKEDPVHFKSFLNVAKLFDYVFTTDMDCIQRYKQSLNHDRVHLLPFAFQPKLHNPISEFERMKGLCFAGAYYKKYHERNLNMNNILTGVQDEIDIDIYDRNFLEDNPDYTFPEEFSKYIVGTLAFDEINLAYKGYEIGLNLNTIKHSQTMFARRVFELLASNTLIFSNYSRGVELLFGELVFNCDSGVEILKRYNKYDDVELRRIKLAGIRNVFSQHTYQHRFRHIISKVSLQDPPVLKKRVLIVAIIETKGEAERIISSFNSQVYPDCSLLLLQSQQFQIPDTKDVTVIELENIKAHFFEELMEESDFLSQFHSESLYGPYFIQDLIHATEYIDNRAITKPIINEKERGFTLVSEKNEYCSTNIINTRSVLFPKTLIMNKPVLPNLKLWKKEARIEFPGFAIDSFNFIENYSQSERPNVENNVLDMKFEYSQLQTRSEHIVPDDISSIGEYFSSANIYQQICDSNKEKVSVEFDSGKTIIESTLGQGEFTYLYWQDYMKPEEIGISNGRGELYFDAAPGLRMMLAVIFYNEKREKIGSKLSLANSNMSFEIPEDTKEVRLGLRVYQQGVSEINSLDLFHRNMTPNHILTTEKILVVSNNYPSYDERYRNGFLHSRLQEYNNNGVRVDMFVLREGGQLVYAEYEGIQVITGSQQALDNILKHGEHQKVLIHFLDSSMWEIIQKYKTEKEILVWVHGSEIQPWHRRLFNYETKQQLSKAKVDSKIRMEFWKPLLNKLPENMKLIFVSEYFAQEVMEDTEIKIPSKSYQIIHNPINTTIFNYVEKPNSQRTKILTIRPFASRKYANDLTAEAILYLSNKEIFKELEFLIVGDGKLFDEILEPLHKFENVTIQRGFLSHSEIADLHKQYGVFLSPTRMDSQGVSRDEAMSSGLVAITTNVTAIPEFVDEKSGILVPGEDYKAMAKAIENLYHNPEKFQSLSQSAAKRVRIQTDSKIIIRKELKLLKLE